MRSLREKRQEHQPEGVGRRRRRPKRRVCDRAKGSQAVQGAGISEGRFDRWAAAAEVMESKEEILSSCSGFGRIGERELGRGC